MFLAQLCSQTWIKLQSVYGEQMLHKFFFAEIYFYGFSNNFFFFDDFFAWTFISMIFIVFKNVELPAYSSTEHSHIAH